MKIKIKPAKTAAKSTETVEEMTAGIYADLSCITELYFVARRAGNVERAWELWGFYQYTKNYLREFLTEHEFVDG